MNRSIKIGGLFMKRAKRLLSLALMAAITLTAMAGCGTQGEPTPSPDTKVVSATEKQPEIDLSKEVELSMYLIGSTSAAYEKAVGELNKKLKEDMNTTVKVSWIGWGDFGTKYPLVLASGEPIDLIYAATWCSFYAQAQKGAFMALEELAPQYAPKSYQEVAGDFVSQATVNGHMYGFPPTFFQYGSMGYIVRGDLMKKYGMTEIKNMEDYGTYLDHVVKNDPQLDPTGFMTTSGGLAEHYAGELGWYNVAQNVQVPFYMNFNDESAKLFNFYETPEMADFFVKMKDWSDKGYWPKSVLSNKDDQMMNNGKAASRIHNLDTWKGMAIKHPEYDVKWFPTWPYAFKTPAMQDGMAIPASSKNPERALMFLEKLRQEQEYYNFLTYGIADETYRITPEDQLEALDLENFAPENFCSWGFKSLKFFKEPVGTPDSLKDIKAQLDARSVDNAYLLFVPNLDSIKNEYAAITNVVQQYAIPLTYGYVEDPVAGLKTLIEKLKEAGSDKVLAELQTQYDAFMATRK